MASDGPRKLSSGKAGVKLAVRLSQRFDDEGARKDCPVIQTHVISPREG
jgi:hypothetical protein